LHEDSVHRGPAQVIPAARSSIYGAMVLAGRILLEPIQKVFINVPQDFMGSAIGEIQSRRGVIEDISQEGEITVIHAKAPVSEIPAGGVCLSAFVIVTDTGHPTNVLMGHMNPRAPWDHIGALDPSRVEVHSRGWMLHSSHLIFQESPGDAARRIAREQLELPNLSFSEPMVVSEAYTPR